MNITYYGELDPFSGSIAQRLDALPRVVRELQALLLVSDVVIVPPRNLIEHPLTLPAFEALAPFVTAGRLTTTTDASSPTPRSFIDTSAAVHLEQLGSNSSRKQASRPAPEITPKPVIIERGRSIHEITNRWHAILPATWTLDRDVDSQVLGFVERMLSFCGNTPDPSPATRVLHATLDSILQAGKVRPDRTVILAHLAARRDHIPPHECARIALAVQTAYFAMGGLIHAARRGRSCRLFPGAFARILKKNAQRVNSLELPQYGHNLAVAAIERRLRGIGIELNRLLAMEPRALLNLVQSVEWQALLAWLHRPAPTLEMEQTLAAVFRRRHDFYDALPFVRGVISTANHSLPITLPAPWQLSVQAVLGASLVEETAEPHARLDLRTLHLAQGDRSIHLTRQEAQLITALVLAGDVGLGTQDINQLLFDIEQLAKATFEPLETPWEPSSKKSVDLDKPRLRRINTLKSRLNIRFKQFGFVIKASRKRRGRVELVATRPSSFQSIQIDGTLWDLLAIPKPPTLPAALSCQQTTLWRALAEAAPRHVHIAALAEALGKEVDERGLKQTVDALGKLSEKLDSLGESTRVVRLQKGLYALQSTPATIRNKRVGRRRSSVLA